ncbi:MAG: ABC transporter substrate-binding protein [Gammaproteobacteria bacterium]
MHFKTRRAGPHLHFAFVLLAALAGTVFNADAATPLAVRLAYVGPAESDSLAGARQGIAEGNAQGKFLGLTFELVDSRELTAALAAKPVAVLVDLPAAEVAAGAAQAAGVAVINIGAEDDQLRARCAPNLLHTLPSAAMRADALRQWKQKSPQSQASAHAWHWRAEMYAGSQLNKRYTHKTGKPMSDQAWAGWAAAKLVTDTAARLKSADPVALLKALREDLAFDGQKGVEMSFRPNGQLRQPLLLVEQDAIVGEAPVRGVATDLDSLGTSDCAP